MKAWGVAGKRMSGIVSKVEKRLHIGVSLLQPFREAYAGGEHWGTTYSKFNNWVKDGETW